MVNLCYMSFCVVVVEAHKVEQVCFESGPSESSANGSYGYCRYNTVYCECLVVPRESYFNPNSVCLGSLILSCWVIRVNSYNAG